MRQSKLARVRWYLGQTLLPGHFQAMEEALLADTRIHAELAGLPQLGIGMLEWNESLLSEGIVSISSLTAVFPGHILVDVPGNAFISALSLKEVTKNQVAVHLHLMSEERSAVGNRLYEGEPDLQRALYVLELSPEPALEKAKSSLKLAEMEKDMNGRWRLVPSYVPPLMLVGPNPFLHPLLAELDKRLESFRLPLVQQLSDSYLSGSRIAATRRCLLEIQRLQSLLEDIGQRVYFHPYNIFAALRGFLLELLSFQETSLAGRLPRYTHEDLSGCIGALLKFLGDQLQPVHLQSRHQPFTRRDGLFLLQPLPEEVRSASETYLIVQRADHSDQVSLSGLKIAALSRLPLVHQLALKGISWERMTKLDFHSSFGPEVDFYRLAGGDEWQTALRENSLAFRALSSLERARVSLYWRSVS